MRRAAPLLVWLALLLAQPATASSPTVWEHPSRPAAAPGSAAVAVRTERDGQRAEGVAVAETGALTLSPPLREILPGGAKMTAPPILWTASLDPSGNLYVGAGNTGTVFRIDRKGSTVSTFDTEEMGVRALAAGATGDLFVGTFPGGGVYKVRPSGKVEPWFDPDDRYIWALAIDNADELFVATGERGIIYQVAAKSEGKAIYDSNEAHITALAFDRSGRLLAGSAPSGLVYRILAGGAAETLLDTGLNEVSALAVTSDGVIYAAAMGEETPPLARKPGEKSDLTIEVTPAPDGSLLEEEAQQPRKITIDLAELLASRTSAGEGAAGRIYRLEPGRTPALVWKSDVERVYSLAWTRDLGLLFGTGGWGAEGRIYRLETDGSATMLHQLREPQVTALLSAPDGRLYACTSNPGRVYMLESGSSPSGSYLSSVYDAGHAARWGTIGWDADVPPGTRIEIATRSGNRPAPDASWSAWSPPCAAETGSPVASPPSRYLQWKAELSRLKTDATPALRRVRVTLLPENRPPVLRGLRVMDPAAALAGPAAAPADRPPADAATGKGPAARETPERAEPPKGTRWIAWSASDPDDDQLLHTIWLRRAGEETFRKVADRVATPPYALADGDLAEGRYVARVDVDDTPSNGAQRALSDSELSAPFVVDHTPPKLEVKRSGGTAAPGRLAAEVIATDAVGTIARGEVSSGGEGAGFDLLPCRDGICDTSRESFLIDLPEPGPGRRITVRVYDAAGNVATVEVP